MLFGLKWFASMQKRKQVARLRHGLPPREFQQQRADRGLAVSDFADLCGNGFASDKGSGSATVVGLGTGWVTRITGC